MIKPTNTAHHQPNKLQKNNDNILNKFSSQTPITTIKALKIILTLIQKETYTQLQTLLQFDTYKLQKNSGYTI